MSSKTDTESSNTSDSSNHKNSSVSKGVKGGQRSSEELRGQKRAETAKLHYCYKLSAHVLANNVSYIALRYRARYQLWS